MKNLFKFMSGIIFATILIMIIILLKNDKLNNNVYAASSGSSDIQLMARAINGEARGEPYEGQVAVGAVILNRVKHSRISKYNCRSNISKRSIYGSFRWSNKWTNK